MSITDNEKTPAAVLADERGEGLENNPSSKELNMHKSTVPTRLDFDGLTVDVQPVVDHVEVTVIAAGRATHGLALDPSEARKLAAALLDASAPAFGHADAAEIDEHVAVARKAQRAISPAKAAAAMRRQRQQATEIPAEGHIDLANIKTVTDIFRESQRTGQTTGQILDLIEEEGLL